MLDKEQLAEVIRGCRHHERGAQNRMYRAFHAWAMAVCQRYTSDPETARECVQDGFFKVFTKIDKYQDDLSFEGWMKKILINTCIDRYRARLREKDTMLEYTELHDTALVPDILVNAEAEHLLFLVRQLPPAYRATFNLFAVEGYDYREVAEMLGVSIGAVKSNLSKARMRLKKLLLDHQATNIYER